MGKSWSVYLGEKVVSEKEYRSAMMDYLGALETVYGRGTGLEKEETVGGRGAGGEGGLKANGA